MKFFLIESLSQEIKDTRKKQMEIWNKWKNTPQINSINELNSRMEGICEESLKLWLKKRKNMVTVRKNGLKKMNKESGAMEL